MGALTADVQISKLTADSIRAADSGDFSTAYDLTSKAQYLAQSNIFSTDWTTSSLYPKWMASISSAIGYIKNKEDIAKVVPPTSLIEKLKIPLIVAMVGIIAVSVFLGKKKKLKS